MAEPEVAEQHQGTEQIHEQKPHEQVEPQVEEQTLSKHDSQTDKAADDPAVEQSGAADAAADVQSPTQSSPADDTPQPPPAAEAPALPAPAVKPAEDDHEQQPAEAAAAAAAAEDEEQQAVQAPLAPTPAVPEQHASADAQIKEQEQQEKYAEEQEAQQQETQGVQEHHQRIPAQHAPRPHKQASPTAAAAAPHSPGSTHGGYGTCPDRAANGKALTFTGPPYVPVAKPYRRVDYSHSSVQLMKIAHDNQLLVNHLTTISKAVPALTKDMNAPPAPGNTASSAVNRRKAATVIAQENHALYQRLVAIRPSKDISRETLEAGHRINETYRANCAQFKSPSSPTRKAAASH